MRACMMAQVDAVHRTAPPNGAALVFADPVVRILRTVLRAPEGSHAVVYGDDSSISASLLERHRSQLGSALAMYAAPNLRPSATQLPYAASLPLGLNHNAKELALGSEPALAVAFSSVPAKVSLDAPPALRASVDSQSPCGGQVPPTLQWWLVKADGSSALGLGAAAVAVRDGVAEMSWSGVGPLEAEAGARYRSALE